MVLERKRKLPALRQCGCARSARPITVDLGPVAGHRLGVRTFYTTSRRPGTGRLRRRQGAAPPLPLSLCGGPAHARRLAHHGEGPRRRR